MKKETVYCLSLWHIYWVGQKFHSDFSVTWKKWVNFLANVIFNQKNKCFHKLWKMSLGEEEELKKFLSLYWMCYNITSVVYVLFFGHEAGGIPDQGLNPHPQHWKAILTPGPLGKSRGTFLRWFLRIVFIPRRLMSNWDYMYMRS